MVRVRIAISKVGAVAKIRRHDMKIFIFIRLCIIALLLVMCYSLCVVASRADERAERMYRKWKGKHDERSR